ncbi:MAG: carbohydrate kinase [Deltaproteobacteria bacterium]|nr:carbohydrate kinase [Deltaproteobacteria bacterium]
MPLHLGLDSSTQSLSALVIDTDTGKVVADRSVNFGVRLPHYRSPNGFLANSDAAIKHADPLMWVEALELVLEDLRDSGVDLGRVAGISGAGQQHGSVYLAKSVDAAGGWSLAAPLYEQVSPLLSRKTAPIWMDSSTSAECAEIAAALGGDERVAAITGSRATLRFTGPQIRRFFKTSPAEWGKTVEIHLVSSFVASLLAGRSAGIDLGDGAGMNLLDLATGTWSQALLDATAPGLRDKLKTPVPSPTVVGEITGYFVKKYGFAKGTKIVAFTGDNPSSLIGMGASKPGTAVISLGTSDTVFAAMASQRTDPRGYGSVFGNPAGGFMSLACFSNGSLAREEIAKRFGLSWDAFASAIVDKTKPGNGGNLLLPYFVPEITPRLLKPEPRWFGREAFVAGKDAAAAARAVVEAQALSMRLHSDWIGEKMHTVLVTGGASRNRGLLRVLADVFQATIIPLSVANSSALGGALRAAQAVEGTAWDDLYARFCPPEHALAVTPVAGAQAAYQELGVAFEAKLKELLR